MSADDRDDVQRELAMDAALRVHSVTAERKSLESVYGRGGPGGRLDFERDAAEVAGWAVVAISRYNESKFTSRTPIDEKWLRAIGFVDYGPRGNIRWTCGQSSIEYYLDTRQFVVNSHIYKPDAFSDRRQVSGLIAALEGASQ